MWRFIFFLTLKTAYSDQTFTTTYAISDQCISVCRGANFPPLETQTNVQLVCQRGCRFFNIVFFKDQFNVNLTKHECKLSCNESYVLAQEIDICAEGCNLMANRRQVDLSTILVMAEEDESNIVLAEPDLEIFESDLLSDPSIKGQLEIGFNTEYKIPETRIRTMPIENGIVYVKTTKYTGDWLDCASRNSGIPRWLLLTAILSAVLIALWLSFSVEKKSKESINDDDKLILDHEEKDPQLFNAPPTYTVESETV